MIRVGTSISWTRRCTSAARSACLQNMSPRPQSKFPNAIKYYRLRLLLRSKELANVVHRRRSLISPWEHRRMLPRLDSALAIAAALQCQVEILFLEQFREIRSGVRKRMPNLQAKHYPDVRSCPMRNVKRQPKVRRAPVEPTAW